VKRFRIARVRGSQASGILTDVGLSADGGYLAFSSGRTTVILCSVTDGHQVQRWAGHKDHVNSVAFCPDGRRLASASDDKTVKLWNLTTSKEDRTFQGHSAAALCESFTPDGR
jgi:WD40 repeat protein